MKEIDNMQRIEVSTLDFVRIEPRGKGVAEKFWVNHDNLRKLVKINGQNSDQDLMEKVSSLILKRLGVNVVDVDLGYDKYAKSDCCLVTSFLDDDEVSYDTYTCDVIRRTDQLEELRLCFDQIFTKYSSLTLIDESNLKQLKKDFIRIIFSKCLTDNLDSKLENIGLIFNERTKQYRIPPSYDNGVAFHSYQSIGAPYCCIGNQYFEIPLIINYLLDNYLDDIKDVISNLDDLVNNDLESLIAPYVSDNIKKQYIIDFMNGLNNEIKQKLNKERKL